MGMGEIDRREWREIVINDKRQKGGRRPSKWSLHCAMIQTGNLT